VSVHLRVGIASLALPGDEPLGHSQQIVLEMRVCFSLEREGLPVLFEQHVVAFKK